MDKNITLKNNNTQRATRNARKSTGSNVPVPVVGGVLRGIKSKLLQERIATILDIVQKASKEKQMINPDWLLLMLTYKI